MNSQPLLPLHAHTSTSRVRRALDKSHGWPDPFPPACHRDRRLSIQPLISTAISRILVVGEKGIGVVKRCGDRGPPIRAFLKVADRLPPLARPRGTLYQSSQIHHIQYMRMFSRSRTRATKTLHAINEQINPLRRSVIVTV